MTEDPRTLYQQLNFAIITHHKVDQSLLISVLLDNPNLDVNNKSPSNNRTILHAAAIHQGNHPDPVRLLLAAPGIEVNAVDKLSNTPLNLACTHNRWRTCEALLDDPRVDVDLRDQYGASPLWNALYFGHDRVLKALILSGRQIDLETRSVGTKGDNDSGWRGMTALEVGAAQGMIGACDLLQRFMADPLTTRHRVQLETGSKGMHHHPLFWWEGTRDSGRASPMVLHWCLTRHLCC